MLQLTSSDFAKAIRAIALATQQARQLEFEASRSGSIVNLAQSRRFLEQELLPAAAFVRRLAESLDLPSSGRAAERLQEVLSALQPSSDNQEKFGVSGEQFARMVANLSQLNMGLKDELEGRTLLLLTLKEARLFEPKTDAFEIGPVAFGSANEDISEAAKCLALLRGTACVMHLQRVYEAGLKALAAKVGVGKQVDWGSYIREIERELERRLKAGKKTPDEQRYSEIVLIFDRVRRAWRNPSMHLERTYSESRAEEIFNATKDFMRHLVAIGITEQVVS